MDLEVVILTLMGADRPGLVGALAERVAAHGGNWEEGRMAHLGGQFVGLLRVTVPGEKRAALEEALRLLGDQGLSVHSLHEAPAAPTPGPLRVHLEVTGQDREGIVRDISTVLSARGVNVEELETRCESAAMTGETLFRARAVLAVPEGGDVDAELGRLRDELEAIGNDLMVDLGTPSGARNGSL